VLPGAREAEAGGSFAPRNLRSAQQRSEVLSRKKESKLLMVTKVRTVVASTVGVGLTAKRPKEHSGKFDVYSDNGAGCISTYGGQLDQDAH
jgi:hypothetical protein